MQTFYPAAFFPPDPDNGRIGVVFPDVPGCATDGETAEDAFKMALDALSGHLAALADGGDPIPPPSTLAEVKPRLSADPDWCHWQSVMLVPVTPPGRTVRLTITIDPNLIARIDQVTANRSRFLADAARAELKRMAAV